MILFFKNITRVVLVVCGFIVNSALFAEPKYSQKDYNLDVMTVSGRAELPNATGSVLENSVSVRNIYVDSKISQAMSTETNILNAILKTAIERSLKNHRYLEDYDTASHKKIVDVKFEFSKFEEFNDKIDISLILRADIEQNSECPTIIANANYTVFKRKVFKKGSKLLSGALGVFIAGSDNIFSKNPEIKSKPTSGPESPKELAWNGSGEGLSPYESASDTRWFGYQKAIQLALTNFLFQVRPLTNCNVQK